MLSAILLILTGLVMIAVGAWLWLTRPRPEDRLVVWVRSRARAALPSAASEDPER